jgi:hypothetical protein
MKLFYAIILTSATLLTGCESINENHMLQDVGIGMLVGTAVGCGVGAGFDKTVTGCISGAALGGISGMAYYEIKDHRVEKIRNDKNNQKYLSYFNKKLNVDQPSSPKEESTLISSNNFNNETSSNFFSEGNKENQKYTKINKKNEKSLDMPPTFEEKHDQTLEPKISILFANVYPESIEKGDEIGLKVDFSVILPENLPEIELVEEWIVKHNKEVITVQSLPPKTRDSGGWKASGKVHIDSKAKSGEYSLTFILKSPNNSTSIQRNFYVE